MLLAAIYVDQHHPVMNCFLKPFTDEMEKLHSSGVEWISSGSLKITSRFIVTTCTLDSPARAAVTSINQFNGFYGCLYCYAKGQSLRPGKFVYPLSQCSKKQRTDSKLRDDMAYAFDNNKKRHVIETISSIVALPLFNIRDGVVVEAMHAVYLGVVRQHTRLLLTSSIAVYYVGSSKSIKVIDNCLLAIKPPSCRSRKPRSITSYQKWKALEWRNWLDYGPICLKEVLSAKYVSHFALLAEAVHHLNSDCISSATLDRCEMLLKAYIKLFEQYFGLENMTSNIHLLTHLVDVVKNWGPIWVHEAFVFESMNKRILDFVTSSFAETDQIATRFLIQKYLINILYDEKVSSETKKFIAKEIKINLEHNSGYARNLLVGFGKFTTRMPTDEERTSLNKIGYDPSNIECFKKMKLNGQYYTCENTKKLKFCNSVIHDGSRTFGKITNMIKFRINNETISGMFIKCFHQVGHAYNNQHIVRATASNNLIFVKESMLIKPAILIETAKDIFDQANE